MFGLGLGGNLDFLTSLDLVAVLDAVGTLDVLNRNSCFLGNLGEGLALLHGHLAGTFRFGSLLAVLCILGAMFGFVILLAVLLG